jgi:hypothetical protein
MTTLARIPNWLISGEISQYLLENCEPDDCEFIIPKPLKLDLIFRNVNDLIECIDTCLYLGLDKLPREVYDFCRTNPVLLDQVAPKYQHFTQTDEFRACQICDMQGDILSNAISENNMACIRYCVEDLKLGDIHHFQLSINKNHIHICRYIIKQYPSWIKPIRMSCGLYFSLAQESTCDITMLSFLREDVGIVWPYNILTMALNHRNTEFAKYAIQHGCRTPDISPDFAVRIGSLEILRLLAEKNVPMNNSFIFNFAVQFDHLEIAKFLYDQGARPNQYTLSLAIDNTRMREFLQQITR